ncbi:AAA family ATPase [Streptomyces netropsis]
MTQPPAPALASQLPHPRHDHYQSLTGAHAMGTKAALETEARVRKAIQHKAMLCIHGHVGLGKTFAVHTALRKFAPGTTLRLRFRQGPNMSEIRGSLWRALALPGEPPNASTDSSDHQIRQSLASTFHVLLLDEVQWLSPTALEYFRALWDDEDNELAILFVGSGNTRQKILNRPALHSRVYDWQQFCPLKPEEVLTTMPAYHQVWADVDPDLILWTDDIGGHGAFRNWAKVTFHLQDAIQDNPGLTVSKDLIRWAFSRMDSTTRYDPGGRQHG